MYLELWSNCRFKAFSVFFSLQGILSALSETTGLSLLVLVAFPAINNSAFSLLVMNSVFLIPLFVSFVSHLRELPSMQCLHGRKNIDETIALEEVNGGGGSGLSQTSLNYRPFILFAISVLFLVVSVGTFMFAVLSVRIL